MESEWVAEKEMFRSLVGKKWIMAERMACLGRKIVEGSRYDTIPLTCLPD